MKRIDLPTRSLEGRFSLNETMQKRVSCRNYKKRLLTFNELSNILWASQGLTDKKHKNHRTIPSAGSTFPLEMYLAVHKDGIDSLEPGIYHYEVEEHALQKISESDISESIVQATWNQEFIKNASFTLLIAFNNKVIKDRYPGKWNAYANMEAGAAAQNIYLEAVDLKLGTVMVGAFDDVMIKDLFNLENLVPLALLPVGNPGNKSLYA
jgi:SagB-type dehydrogenase family enzyme